MPLGLKNTAQKFQRLMDCLFSHPPLRGRPLDRQQVFPILREAGLRINTAKCVFVTTEQDVLGLWVSSPGVSPPARHVDSLLHFPLPADIKFLKCFLGQLLSAVFAWHRGSGADTDWCSPGSPDRQVHPHFPCFFSGKACCRRHCFPCPPQDQCGSLSGCGRLGYAY